MTYGRGTAIEFVSRPADAVRSLKCAAELKVLSEAEVADATTENARALFSLL